MNEIYSEEFEPVKRYNIVLFSWINDIWFSVFLRYGDHSNSFTAAVSDKYIKYKNTLNRTVSG